MFITRPQFKELLTTFNFQELFLTLGWDNVKYDNTIDVNNIKYKLDGIVQKRGFIVISCYSKNGFPDANTRKKIDNQISRHYFEHLIIYHDNSQKQIWQISIKEPNKPIQIREFEYLSNQEPSLLYSKLDGFLFTLEEEDKIGLVDVKSRVTEQFNKNAEKITKKFYTEFKEHHEAFQKFIEGLDSKADIDWYTSLMLNRLMFVYFIQKKGFLDGNNNYLSEKLKATVKKNGDNKFYKSFYKTFLLTLFHSGLGKPNHSKEFEIELGKIPYLNGGLFDVHELEKNNDKLNIPDKAFKKLFAFFDRYNWHLDVRADATGNDINPDVIGYIFEKYINDRASMGAYYTKEDITEYIGKNTIIPFLFDKVKEKVKNAFNSDSSLWNMLKDNPDRYIYDAVNKGIDGNIDIKLSLAQKVADGLPDYITKGLDTTKPNLLERRKRWNEKTEDEIALPTEIWRETIERRNRYWELREKINNGEINEINDFITYNLNIRQFAQDAIEQYEGSDFINAFYNTIKEITILDPTAGSGAFLFAALNILEPLYEASISRMKEFVETDNEKGTGKKHSNFRNVLDEIKVHTNEKYYIYKSIILNNLYGVDIMKEATEIAKLRLFLKLVAVVEPDINDKNYGLEPLPDIDFNIKAGNTLVGFVSYKEIENAVEEKEAGGSFVFSDEKKAAKIAEDEANIVADLYKEFKQQQSINNPNSIEYKKTKDNVIERLRTLNETLNKLLANQYDIDDSNKKQYSKWLSSHKPFHWFAEYYEIIHQNGGFDVIIGNPPYVEYSKIKKSYSLLSNSFFSLSCNNLYAFVVEKSEKLTNKKGKLGLIIPISLVSTQRMLPLVNQLKESLTTNWLSFYAERPSKLFTGAEVLLTISIMDKNKLSKTKLFTTSLRKWNATDRDHLFNTTFYVHTENYLRDYLIPKINSIIEKSIMNKVFIKSDISLSSSFALNTTKNKIFYRIGGGRYWKIFTNFQPKFILNGNKTISSRESYLYFNSLESKNISISVLSSSLFFWYFIVSTNGRDMNPFDLNSFPIDISTLNSKLAKKLNSCVEELMTNYKQNKEIKNKVSSKTGEIVYEEFYPRLAKNILDDIDKVLAKHYGFTEEELDFIINYDIKYRMGKELNNGE